MAKDGNALTSDRDTLRRRQGLVIAAMLDYLPGLDNLPAEATDQLRDALLHADHPFLIVLVGPFSSGKSSIINALMGRGDLMPVGVTPTTDHISILRHGEQEETLQSDAGVTSVFFPSPLLGKVSFVDTPGLDSVFRGHEEMTRGFLHRADVVFLVMPATQALTARNIEYLQQLKRYGTRVIVLLNQIDLLSDGEARKVLDFVREESRIQLESEPEVWPLSARQGQEAWRAGTLDEEAWRASGMHRIVAWVDDQLADRERLRQKLRTSLQITRNVLRQAEAALDKNQEVTRHCEAIAANMEEQLLAQRRDQEAAVERIVVELGESFDRAGASVNAMAGGLFRVGRTPDLLRRGLLELIGLGGLTRRGGVSYVQREFLASNLDKPLAEPGRVSARLAPRLEGQDMQDLDDLVTYALRELESLPAVIQAKLIGRPALPQSYDRRVMDRLPGTLDDLVSDANWPDTEALDRQLRNAGLYLAVYEIILLVIAFTLSQVYQADPALLALLLLTPLLALAGLLSLPFRGRSIVRDLDSQRQALRDRYCAALREASRQQLERSMQMRRDALAPLLRLVTAQTQLQQTQRAKLQEFAQELDSIEAGLVALGARGPLPRQRVKAGGGDVRG